MLTQDHPPGPRILRAETGVRHRSVRAGRPDQAQGADHDRRRATAERLPAGHIPGAINLPRASGTRSPGLTKDRTAVIYCYSQTCKLAAAAAVEFASAGIPVVEMEGGFEAWVKNGLPIETAE